MKIRAPFFNRQSAVGVLLILALVLSLFAFPQGVSAQLSFPAEINKEFSPISIPAGGVSRLSITIFNPNLFQLTNAAWADNLIGVQPGITIANPVNLTNTCGGTVVAPAGGTALSLSGGSVPPQVGIAPGSCTVTIDVTSTTPGNLINTIPAGGLTGTGGGGTITNTTPASATLRVDAVLPPLIGKTFNPNTILVGQVSQLTIAINNVDPNTALTQTTFTDNLPANVVLANPVGAALNGCGAGTLSAVSGGTSLTLNDATITPGAVCLITVNVTSTVEGAYTNTIPAGAIQTEQAVTNQGPATAPLNVQGTQLTKAFSPSNVEAGGTTTLTITIQNPATSPLTGVNLSDTLPAGLNVVAGSAATTCGGVASTTPPGTVTLTGGTVPAANPPTPGTCTITVQVSVPAGTNPATFTNTIPAGSLVTDQGTSNATAATAPLRVYTPGEGVRAAKLFIPPTISPGESSMIRITITAPADTNLTNFSITDNLPPNVTVSNFRPAARSASCGAGSILTAVTGATSVTLTNGTILAGTTCTIDVFVTTSVAGVHTNTIDPTDITNNEGETIPDPISANLTVRTISDLSTSKVFTPATIGPNGTTLLTISLRNTNASPLVNVSLLDTLPGDTTNGVVVAAVPNASTTCGGGVVTAVPGTQTISLSGGTIPAQVGGVPGLCTITLNVQGRGASSIYTNIIPTTNVTGTIQGTTTVLNPIANATAPLTITDLSIGVVKGFNPLTVFGGSASVMSILLVNPNNADLIGIAFTDNMPAGMIVANPVNPTVGTCGGAITATPGNGFFSFSGGSLPPFGSCTLTLNITMTVNGNLTNTIAAGAVTTTNGASNPQPAQASLTNLPGASVSKAFSPNPINAGDFSLLTITIQNTGNIPLTGMGLNDVLPGALPAGLAIAGAPAPAPVNNCGGTLVAVAGTQQIQLTNGSLAASSSCTIVVAVTSTVVGSYQNIIPAGNLTSNEGATNNTPATDTLVVNGGNPTTASLGNYVWNDTNADGIQDGTETGIDGVTVNLYDSNGNLVGTTTTSNGGMYLFTGLTPGDYYVEFIPPPGYTFSPQDQGGNDAADSDANPVNGRTIITTLTAGENDLTWDAGLFQQQGPNGLSKTITATNLPTTSGTSTAIGEIVTYEVQVTVPPGIYTNATLVDTMQRGLAFVDCDSITAPGLTTDVAGSFAAICSNPVTSDAGGGTPADVDRRVTYNFGVLTNAGQTNATITLIYRAIVLDIAPNVSGSSLNNSVTWSWTGGSIGPAQTTVTVAEPALTIAKTANVNFISNGSEVTFTLTISHTQTSNADAYDVVVTDVLPTGLSYVANSLDCTVGAQDPDAGCTFDNTNPAQPTIRAAWTVFTRNGGTSQIRFRVAGNASLPANGNVTNTANVEWTSMPGDQTTPQSSTPNIFSTERFYDPGDPVNIYNNSSAVALRRVGTGGTRGGGNNQAGGFFIPVTGFAPNTVTDLDSAARPVYTSTSLTLEIPSIRVNAPIVGVQLNAGDWDVSWLVDQAGWLEGTAYPTWNGNSVLTAHAVNADGKPGIFSRLGKVRPGEHIFLYQSGYKYTYRIVSNTVVPSNDINVLKHEDKATITLITCDTYNEKTGTYLRRVVIRAVLVDVSTIE